MEIVVDNWGIIDYGKALEKQTMMYEEAKSLKNEGKTVTNVIVECEHPHVYTIGKSGKDSNMLLTETMLKNMGIDFYHIKRGGDITYHGPGQIVLYPILDLEQFGLGLKEYVYVLEEAVIRTCEEWNVTAGRLEGATGVWIEPHTPRERKICAIGVQSSRFITMHGLAFNVNTDLKYFHNINPCGFTNKGVTSLAKELGNTQDIDKVRDRLVENLRLLLTTFKKDRKQ